MKRNKDLVRLLLLSIENNDLCELRKSQSYEDLVINRHIELLIQANFVEDQSYGVNNNVFEHYLLTWEGYEFLDSIKNNETWNTIKEQFAAESVSTIKNVAKQLSEGYIKKKLNALLSE